MGVQHIRVGTNERERLGVPAGGGKAELCLARFNLEVYMSRGF